MRCWEVLVLWRDQALLKFSTPKHIIIMNYSRAFAVKKGEVFESVLLNEFLNHQIAQNTVYVQVENSVRTD